MNTIHAIIELLSERPGGGALDLLPGVVTWSFRLAFIIGVGLLSVAALGRCSAALRSRLLLIAMVGAMLLPLAGRGLPALRVLAPPLPAVRVAAPEVLEIKGELRQGSRVTVAEETPVAGRTTELVGDSKVPRGDVPVVLFVIWAVGVLVIGGRYLVGLLVLRQVRRQGKRAGEPLLEALASAKRKIGVRREVDLVVTDQRSMPMTWGVLRPVILLPHEAIEKADTILLHELAHIRRNDALAQIFATLVVALHWFNPVVWLAKRKLVALREEACDEQVLDAGGVRASDYATVLVDLASAAPANRCEGAAGLAMAGASRLGLRTEAILRAVRPGEQGWVRLTVIALFAVLAVGLCVLGGVLSAEPQWGEEVIVTLSTEPGKNRVTFPGGEFETEDHLEHSHYLQWRDSWAPGLALKKLRDGAVSLVVQNAGTAPASGRWDVADRLFPPIAEENGVLGMRDVDRFGGIVLRDSFDLGLDGTQTWLLERYGRMQVLSFDKERGAVKVRFQFRKPMVPLNAPTRGPADDEPIPTICIYVPEALLPCVEECSRAFVRDHPGLGAVRVDAPKIPMLGLYTEKGIAITDWRPDKANFGWMEPLKEATFTLSGEVADGGNAGKETTYAVYHWPDVSGGEAAFLEWLRGKKAMEIAGRHGFSIAVD